MAGYSTPSWINEASPAISAAALSAIGQALELSQHPYGVCTTAAATSAKTVTVDFSGTLTLYEGLTIRVLFQYGNSSTGNLTLDVNGTGAVSFRADNGGSTYIGVINANTVVEIVYTGTIWVLCGKNCYNKSEASAIFARIKAGTYIGNGSNSWNAITVGFAPQAVLIFNSGRTESQYAKFFTTDAPLNINGATEAEIYGNGFRVKAAYGDDVWKVNISSQTYYYVAIG